MSELEQRVVHDLHERLIALQTKEELERKQRKAQRAGWWTVEDLDLAKRNALMIGKRIGWL